MADPRLRHSNEILGRSRRHVPESTHTRLQFLSGLGAGALAAAVPAPVLASLGSNTTAPSSGAGLDRHLRIYGFQPPTDIVYTVWADNNFRGYTIPIGGDVERPIALDINELRAMPQRTQITRLSCVKGWSAVGKWRGAELGAILAMVRPMAHARFVVFHCFDRDHGGTPFYESLDLQQAADPRTLLALEVDDRPIDRNHGGPVRLQAPAQPGYKNAKWIRRIDVVSSFRDIAGGKGGYWEDRGLA
jgi:DMSO/TMAO reductase YedYZ molybdopterin-dependent catalytic subunit